MLDRTCVAALLLVTVACGGSEPTTDGRAAGGVGAGAAAPSAAVEPPAGDEAEAAEGTDGEPFAFTAADLDAYARGLAKETELVRAAQERAGSAATPAERAAAAQAQWEDQTAPEAARLLGLDAERYRRTRDTVGEVLRTLDFQGTIDGPLSIDLTRVDEATRAELQRDPFEKLAPASAAALRDRLPELVAVWSEYTRLTAVAG